MITRKKNLISISVLNFADLSWQPSVCSYPEALLTNGNNSKSVSQNTEPYHSCRSLDITCISCVSVFFIYLTVTLLWALPRPALTSLCRLNLTYHNCLCCLTSSFSMRFSHCKKISIDNITISIKRLDHKIPHTNRQK